MTEHTEWCWKLTRRDLRCQNMERLEQSFLDPFWNPIAVHIGRKTDLFLPGEFDREDVLKAAETFLDGNTDYKTPLQEALRLMEEAGFENADMVFVTDGACTLPGDFLDHLKEEQARRGFSITGVLLDRAAAGFSFSLEPFCTEILRTSELTQEKIAENLLNARAA